MVKMLAIALVCNISIMVAADSVKKKVAFPARLELPIELTIDLKPFKQQVYAKWINGLPWICAVTTSGNENGIDLRWYDAGDLHPHIYEKDFKPKPACTDPQTGRPLLDVCYCGLELFCTPYVLGTFKQVIGQTLKAKQPKLLQSILTAHMCTDHIEAMKQFSKTFETYDENDLEIELPAQLCTGPLGIQSPFINLLNAELCEREGFDQEAIPCYKKAGLGNNIKALEKITRSTEMSMDGSERDNYLQWSTDLYQAKRRLYALADKKWSSIQELMESAQKS